MAAAAVAAGAGTGIAFEVAGALGRPTARIP